MKPLPAGVTGDEQRQRTIDAYERAVALMPEAPPAPYMLYIVGNLWEGGQTTSEQPDKAIAVFKRIVQEYPENHHLAVSALEGVATSYEIKEDWASAVTATQQILDYSLPANVDAATRTYVEELKKRSMEDLKRRDARLHGAYLIDGKVTMPGAKEPSMSPDLLEALLPSTDSEVTVKTSQAAAQRAIANPASASKAVTSAPARSSLWVWLAASFLAVIAIVVILVARRKKS